MRTTHDGTLRWMICIPKQQKLASHVYWNCFHQRMYLTVLNNSHILRSDVWVTIKTGHFAAPVCKTSTLACFVCRCLLSTRLANTIGRVLTGKANSFFASSWTFDYWTFYNTRRYYSIVNVAVKFPCRREKIHPPRLWLASALVKRQRKNDVVKKV